MIRSLICAVLVLALAPATAAAEVVSRGPDGFILKFSRTADIDPARIPAALRALPKWWEASHTYSGDADNLSLDLMPGGCWCERLADGTEFDHGRTVEVADDRVTFNAPFGPLRGKATRAELTVTWPEVDGRRAPTWVLIVEGPGLGAMAEGVAGVIGTAHARWLSYLETGEPPPA